MTQFDQMLEELRTIRELLQIMVEALPERPALRVTWGDAPSMTLPCEGCGKPIDHLGPSQFCVACEAAGPLFGNPAGTAERGRPVAEQG